MGSEQERSTVVELPDGLTPEQEAEVIAGVIRALVAKALEQLKAPKWIPAKVVNISGIPRGLDQRRGFKDIPDGWAEGFRQGPPVPIHERRLKPEEAPSSVLRLMAMGTTSEDERVWLSNVQKHRAICGPWAKHHEGSCPYRKPREIEKPNPTLAVWKRDRRCKSGGRWVDPATGELVGGMLDALQPKWTADDLKLQQEDARSKYKGWTAEKDAVGLLESQMFADMHKPLTTVVVERWREKR